MLQQSFQLHLAKHAPGFDIGEHALQAAHAVGEFLHLPQTVVHLLQALGHLFEALRQAFFQGGLEFFVHRAAHFVELVGIAFLQLLQLLVQGVGERLLHQAQLLQLVLLLLRRIGEQGLLLLRQSLRQFLASTA